MSKLVAVTSELKEIIFTNLFSLGFDCETNNAKYRITFDKDMFNVPNRKGMEVLIHFLFIKLNKDSTKETFRNCWPIANKKQEHEFRKLSIQWLTSIKKDDAEAHLPTMVPSLLQSPSGDKFLWFLFYFSSYVLKQELSKIKGHNMLGRPTISISNHRYFEQIVQSLDIRTINSKSDLIAYVENTKKTKYVWSEFAKDLSKEYLALNRKKRHVERQFKELNETFKEVFGCSSLSSKESLTRAQNLQKGTQLLKTVKRLYETSEVIQDEIKSLVNKTTNQTVIKGEEINFKIPDILLRECEQQLHVGKRYENIYEGGNVNLVSLVQLWNLSLHLIKETLSHYPLPNLKHDQEYIRKHAHERANNLKIVSKLQNNLSKHFLPDLNMSIKELQETLFGNINPQSHMKFDNNKFGLDILPATPPVDFDLKPDLKGVHSSIGKYQYVEDVNTPDAVNNLLYKLQKEVEKGQDITPVHMPGNKKVIPVNHNKGIPVLQNKNKKVDKIKSQSKQASRIPSKVVKAPQDILTEQIIQSVLNEKFEKSRSSSDEDERTPIHAINNPLEAYSTNAFVSRSNILRTPAAKKMKETSFFPVSTPGLDTWDLDDTLKQMRSLNLMEFDFSCDDEI